MHGVDQFDGLAGDANSDETRDVLDVQVVSFIVGTTNPSDSDFRLQI